MPWNDEYAPEGWDYELFRNFNQGRPDVTFMAYDPKNAPIINSPNPSKPWAMSSPYEYEGQSAAKKRQRSALLMEDNDQLEYMSQLLNPQDPDPFDVMKFLQQRASR